MIINGRDHAVGSDRAGVLRLIDRERRNTATVDVAMRGDGAEIVVRAGPTPAGGLRQKATLVMMTVTPSVAVDIERGENTGSEIVYYNVVRAMRPVGAWRGDALDVKLATSQLSDGQDGCVCLLQADDSDQILGAAAWRPATPDLN